MTVYSFNTDTTADEGRAPELQAVNTPQEAAAFLRVSPRTVTRLCDRGDIKAVRVGAQWRISRATLLQYAGVREGGGHDAEAR